MHILFSISLVLVAHSFTLNAAQAVQNQPRKHTAEQQDLAFSPSTVPANKRTRFDDGDNDDDEVESPKRFLAVAQSPQTPVLGQAIQEGDIAAVQALIEGGADVTARTDDFNHSIVYFAFFISDEAVRNTMLTLLINKGAPVCKDSENLMNYFKFKLPAAVSKPTA